MRGYGLERKKLSSLETAFRRCSTKQVLLRFLKFHEKRTASLSLKKESSTQVLPYEFCKVFNNHQLQNIDTSLN